MSHSSEDETDISDSELDEYVDRCYVQLKDGKENVKYSDKLYRCPYCPGKKKLVYLIKDLLQHAVDVGKGSQNKDIKHKAKHLGLVKYIKKDIDNGNLSSQFAGLALDSSVGKDAHELFVWPWMGILAKVDGESISKIKGDLAKGGFDPVRVRPLATGGYAVVEFKKDWCGFYKAVMFEKKFEVDHCGKKDYLGGTRLGDELYGWLAKDDDFNSNGILGNYLRKNGDLKSLSGLEEEEKRKNGLLIDDLRNTIEELRVRIGELECSYNDPPKARCDMASKKD